MTLYAGPSSGTVNLSVAGRSWETVLSPNESKQLSDRDRKRFIADSSTGASCTILPTSTTGSEVNRYPGSGLPSADQSAVTRAETGLGQLAHYNRWVCLKVLQGVRRQWVAATACAAALAVIAVACSEDSGSPTPPTPTPPTRRVVVVNTPPVIQSITVSSPRVDTTDEIQVTSVVQDAGNAARSADVHVVRFACDRDFHRDGCSGSMASANGWLARGFGDAGALHADAHGHRESRPQGSRNRTAPSSTVQVHYNNSGCRESANSQWTS